MQLFYPEEPRVANTGEWVTPLPPHPTQHAVAVLQPSPTLFAFTSNYNDLLIIDPVIGELTSSVMTRSHSYSLVSGHVRQLVRSLNCIWPA